MQKRVFYVILALWIGCMSSSVAQAKVWALPDYQEGFSNRKNDGISHEPNDPTSYSCSTYGGFSSSTLKSGHVCEGSFYIGGQLCCTSSSCSKDYQYTASDCTKNGKIGGGETCSDGGTTYYTYCKCDTSVYPYSSSECVPSLSGASCTDDDGTHYETCGKDPCAGKTTVTCAKALGCAETCGGNCIRCNPQPNCDPGYRWNDDLGCVANTCAPGFATSSTIAEDCGMSFSNSHWELGSTVKGQSGDSYCYNCVIACNDGYDLNSGQSACVPSECPSGSKTAAADCGTVRYGVYELGSTITGYSGTTPCKTCEVKCNDGYIKTTNASNVAVCELAIQCNATLTSCPKGYECISCIRDGTTYYEKTGNCASGYAKMALGLDKETCYDTKCAFDSLLDVPENSETISLQGGKIYVSGCKSGYSALYSNGCISKCVGAQTVCSFDEFTSRTQACGNCPFGYETYLEPPNLSMCYRCCNPATAGKTCYPCPGYDGELPTLKPDPEGQLPVMPVI